jgi:predicted membrane protein
MVSFALRLLYRRVRAPSTPWIGALCAPEPVSTTWRKDNFWEYRDLNSDPSVVEPIATRYTECAIPASTRASIAIRNLKSLFSGWYSFWDTAFEPRLWLRFVVILFSPPGNFWNMCNVRLLSSSLLRPPSHLTMYEMCSSQPGGTHTVSSWEILRKEVHLRDESINVNLDMSSSLYWQLEDFDEYGNELRVPCNVWISWLTYRLSACQVGFRCMETVSKLLMHKFLSVRLLGKITYSFMKSIWTPSWKWRAENTGS